MRRLSILIPTYNCICKELVSELQKQAAALPTDYEVIVADDGSTAPAVISQNRQVNALPCCRYVEHSPNVGRAAIRNYLARQAQYEWLVFIDSDMVVRRSDYVRQYAECGDNDVVYGGVSIGGDASQLSGNLRYRYEKHEEWRHTAAMRQASPYQDFHTANFMIRRERMLSTPFDERFRHYGYEDVLLGKQLQQQGVSISHIDNPLSFEVFEDNATFIGKTEEGLHTLHTFRSELHGYSRLTQFSERHRWAAPLLRLSHRLWGSHIRKQLTGANPSLLLFKIYKIGYFLSLR